MEAVAGFPRYDQYKDSGVEWLGEIPPDWGLTKLRYEMQLINGAAFKPSDWGHEGIPIVRIQNLNGGEVYNYVKPSRKVDPKYHLEKGDLVFSWSGNVGTSFGAFRWENEFKAYLNQHIFKITAYKNYSDRFLYWLLKAVTTEVEA
jgi:type I restriction enzyme S subunit